MPSVSVTFNFGSGKAGLSTVGYQVFDADWNAQGARSQVGVREAGSGMYIMRLDVVDGFVGFVRGDTGEAVPRYDAVPVNFELPLQTAPPLYDSPPVFSAPDPVQVVFSAPPAPDDDDDVPPPPSAPPVVPVFSPG